MCETEHECNFSRDILGEKLEEEEFFKETDCFVKKKE